jgi:hypothetical protein
MIPPHRYNKITKKAEPNPDFVNLYSDRAKDHYTAEELREADMPKLANKVEKDLTKEPSNQGIKFRGNTKKGVERTIKNAK